MIIPARRIAEDVRYAVDNSFPTTTFVVESGFQKNMKECREEKSCARQTRSKAPLFGSIKQHLKRSVLVFLSFDEWGGYCGV